MSWAAAATAGAGIISGLGSKKSGGAAAAPIQNTGSFGPVTFGARYYGSDAVKAAPAITAAQNDSVSRWLPWVVGIVAAAVAAVLIFTGRRRKN